jgi:hypothetical protein
LIAVKVAHRSGFNSRASSKFELRISSLSKASISEMKKEKKYRKKVLLFVYQISLYYQKLFVTVKQQEKLSFRKSIWVGQFAAE